LKFAIFNNQFSNLYYEKRLKTIDINKKTILIEIRQTIKCESATLTKTQKMRKTNIDQILFETIMLFRERLVSTIKANKQIFKILINENIFFNLALFFVSQNSKLLKRYKKKFKTIKTNLIVR